MTNFLISHFNLITLIVWTLFFVIVVVRVVRSAWVKNISFNWLISIAVGLHLLWGALATWAQYIVWGMNPSFRAALTIPLDQKSPLSPLPEFSRPLFEGTHGAFAFYSFYSFFLSTLVLFSIVLLFVLFFKLHAKYRPAVLKDGDIQIIALSFLIVGSGLAGWAGIVVLVPLSLLLAVVLVLVKAGLKKGRNVSLSNAFLVATPFALVFTAPLLSFVHLWPLLKI